MAEEFIREYSNTENILSEHPMASDENPILIVDDDIDFHNIIERCYRKSGRQNELLLFDNCEACLEYMKEAEHDRKPIPALILLDVNIPGLNGFELLKEIKNVEKFKHIPIIFMLSNSEAPPDIQRAEDDSADGYLVKSGSIQTYIEFFNKL